jgi:hypothetical protein
MATELTTIPLSGTISLQVRLGHGTIRIETGDHPTQATVRLTPRGGRADTLERVSVELRDGALVVAGPRQGGLTDILRGWRDGRDVLDASIQVPDGSRVTVASASNVITVTGRCGDADIVTAAGQISLDDVDGALRLRYGHADCRAGAVTGPVQLSAGSGSARFASVGGAFTGKLGRGDVEIQVAQGDVHARSGYGAVSVGAVYGDLDVVTGHGPIDLGIPTGVAARVDAVTGHGHVVSDLPVQQEPAHGAAAITIRARSGSGDIRLQQAAAFAA